VAKAEIFGAWGMVNYLGMMKFQSAISDLSPKYLVAILLPNIWGGYFAPYGIIPHVPPFFLRLVFKKPNVVGFRRKLIGK